MIAGVPRSLISFLFHHWIHGTAVNEDLKKDFHNFITPLFISKCNS